MGKPRLPWKRGPAAWKIARRADSILETLNGSRRGLYSLRRTAKLLGVSTQPVRDWIRLKHLRCDGPRGQIAKTELERLVGWLARRAAPFDPMNYLERIPQKLPFQKLSSSCFVWPKGRHTLKPSELAALINCHPSLIVKAVRCGRLRMSHEFGCHCRISRKCWRNSFPPTFDVPSTEKVL